MLQVYINSSVLDCAPDALEQFAFDFQAFPLYDFSTVTSGFTGSITFPKTKTNQNIFGKVDLFNLDNGVVRSYPALIQYAGITYFKGTAFLDSLSSEGYELRFETGTQSVFETLKDATLWDVLKDLELRTSSNDLFNTKFDEEGVVGYYDPIVLKTSTEFPLIDNGLFKNSDKYVNFFDLRPAFKLQPLVKYISQYVNRTLQVDGTNRLQDLFLTPNTFSYGEQFREQSKMILGTTGTTQIYTDLNNVPAVPIIGGDTRRIKYQMTDVKLGKFTNTETFPSGVVTFNNVRSSYSWNATYKVSYTLKFTIFDVIYTGETTRNGMRMVLFLNPPTGGLVTPKLTVLPNFKAGASAALPVGITPTATVTDFYGGQDVIIDALACQSGYGYLGGAETYFELQIDVEFSKFYSNNSDMLFTSLSFDYGLFRSSAAGQGDWNMYIQLVSNNNELLTVTHDEVILPNGFISAADLLSNLKAADVLKLALRQAGAILTDTGTQLTITSLSQLTRTNAVDWSGKLANSFDGSVDFIEDNLGLNNYLTFSQNENNGNVSEFYQSINLQSTGKGDVILYNAPVDQTINSNAFLGFITLPLIQFFDIQYSTKYNAYSTSLTYTAGQLVGFRNDVYRVLRTVAGSAGFPSALASDYALLDRSELNEQDAGNRCIYLEPSFEIRIAGFSGGGVFFAPWKGNNKLAGFENTESLYGFLKDTFLDYRTFSILMDLTLIDIQKLSLTKLVYIKELNGYFYINKIEQYTPAPLLTTVLLTRIK